MYACDITWWDRYFDDVATSFAGELWTVSEHAREKYGVQWILGQDQSGLSPAGDYIHTGKNSGFQAIGLAYLFGAARVVLVGFDLCLGPKNEKHWHGDHPRGLGNGGASRFGSWIAIMRTLADDLKKTPCEVINASRRTALKCFPRVTLETALHEIRSPR